MVQTMTPGKSPIPVSLEKHRNEEKDSLSKKKQESQGRVTKRNKMSRKRKDSTSGKIQILRQLTNLHQQKRKRKPNFGDIINCQRFKYL